MPILHMETEQVRAAASELIAAANAVTDQDNTLNQMMQNLAFSWQGPSAAQFLEELTPMLQRLRQLAEVGTILGIRVHREVAEWEMADGQGGIGPGGIVLGPDGKPAFDIDFNTSPGMDFISGREWQKGDQFDPEYTGFRATLAEDEWKTGKAAYDETFSGRYGTINVKGLGYDVEAEGSISLGEDGLLAAGGVSAGAYLAQAGYQGQFGPGYATGEVTVGAEVWAEGEFEFNPLEGDVEFEGEVGAFAGVNAQGEVGAEFGPLNGSVGGQIGVGAGAGANIDVGFDDGVFEFDFGAYAYLGVGGGVDYSIELDVPELAGNIVELGEEVVDAPWLPWNW